MSLKDRLEPWHDEPMKLGAYLALRFLREPPGTIVPIGQRTLAKKWGWNRYHVRRWVEEAEKLGLIRTLEEEGFELLSGDEPYEAKKNGEPDIPEADELPMPGEVKRNRVPGKRMEYPECFEELWDAYPRRPGHSKLKGYERYRQRRCDGWQHRDLLEAVRRYADEREDEDPKYTMHGSTFLNDPDKMLAMLEEEPEPEEPTFAEKTQAELR